MQCLFTVFLPLYQHILPFPVNGKVPGQGQDPVSYTHLDVYKRQIPGIDKARADEAVANGFTTGRNVAGVISVALIAILLLVSVFIIRCV